MNKLWIAIIEAISSGEITSVSYSDSGLELTLAKQGPVGSIGPLKRKRKPRKSDLPTAAEVRGILAPNLDIPEELKRT